MITKPEKKDEKKEKIDLVSGITKDQKVMNELKKNNVKKQSIEMKLGNYPDKRAKNWNKINLLQLSVILANFLGFIIGVINNFNFLILFTGSIFQIGTVMIFLQRSLTSRLSDGFQKFKSSIINIIISSCAIFEMYSIRINSIAGYLGLTYIVFPLVYIIGNWNKITDIIIAKPRLELKEWGLQYFYLLIGLLGLKFAVNLIEDSRFLEAMKFYLPVVIMFMVACSAIVFGGIKAFRKFKNEILIWRDQKLQKITPRRLQVKNHRLNFIKIILGGLFCFLLLLNLDISVKTLCLLSYSLILTAIISFEWRFLTNLGRKMNQKIQQIKRKIRICLSDFNLKLTTYFNILGTKIMNLFHLSIINRDLHFSKTPIKPINSGYVEILCSSNHELRHKNLTRFTHTLEMLGAIYTRLYRWIVLIAFILTYAECIGSQTSMIRSVVYCSIIIFGVLLTKSCIFLNRPVRCWFYYDENMMESRCVRKAITRFFVSFITLAVISGIISYGNYWIVTLIGKYLDGNWYWVVQFLFVLGLTIPNLAWFIQSSNTPCSYRMNWVESIKRILSNLKIKFLIAVAIIPLSYIQFTGSFQKIGINGDDLAIVITFINFVCFLGLTCKNDLRKILTNGRAKITESSLFTASRTRRMEIATALLLICMNVSPIIIESYGECILNRWSGPVLDWKHKWDNILNSASTTSSIDADGNPTWMFWSDPNGLTTGEPDANGTIWDAQGRWTLQRYGETDPNHWMWNATFSAESSSYFYAKTEGYPMLNFTLIETSVNSTGGIETISLDYTLLPGENTIPYEMVDECKYDYVVLVNYNLGRYLKSFAVYSILLTDGDAMFPFSTDEEGIQTNDLYNITFSGAGPINIFLYPYFGMNPLYVKLDDTVITHAHRFSGNGHEYWADETFGYNSSLSAFDENVYDSDGYYNSVVIPYIATETYLEYYQGGKAVQYDFNLDKPGNHTLSLAADGYQLMGNNPGPYTEFNQKFRKIAGIDVYFLRHVNINNATVIVNGIYNSQNFTFREGTDYTIISYTDLEDLTDMELGNLENAMQNLEYNMITGKDTVYVINWKSNHPQAVKPDENTNFYLSYNYTPEYAFCEYQIIAAGDFDGDLLSNDIEIQYFDSFSAVEKDDYGSYEVEPESGMEGILEEWSEAQFKLLTHRWDNPALYIDLFNGIQIKNVSIDGFILADGREFNTTNTEDDHESIFTATYLGYGYHVIKFLYHTASFSGIDQIVFSLNGLIVPVIGNPESKKLSTDAQGKWDSDGDGLCDSADPSAQFSITINPNKMQELVIPTNRSKNTQIKILMQKPANDYYAATNQRGITKIWKGEGDLYEKVKIYPVIRLLGDVQAELEIRGNIIKHPGNPEDPALYMWYVPSPHYELSQIKDRDDLCEYWGYGSEDVETISLVMRDDGTYYIPTGNDPIDTIPADYYNNDGIPDVGWYDYSPILNSTQWYLSKGFNQIQYNYELYKSPEQEIAKPTYSEHYQEYVDQMIKREYTIIRGEVADSSYQFTINIPKNASCKQKNGEFGDYLNLKYEILWQVVSTNEYGEVAQLPCAESEYYQPQGFGTAYGNNYFKIYDVFDVYPNGTLKIRVRTVNGYRYWYQQDQTFDIYEDWYGQGLISTDYFSIDLSAFNRLYVPSQDKTDKFFADWEHKYVNEEGWASQCQYWTNLGFPYILHFPYQNYTGIAMNNYQNWIDWLNILNTEFENFDLLDYHLDHNEQIIFTKFPDETILDRYFAFDTNLNTELFNITQLKGYILPPSVELLREGDEQILHYYHWEQENSATIQAITQLEYSDATYFLANPNSASERDILEKLIRNPSLWDSDARIQNEYGIDLSQTIYGIQKTIKRDVDSFYIMQNIIKDYERESSIGVYNGILSNGEHTVEVHTFNYLNEFNDGWMGNYLPVEEYEGRRHLLKLGASDTTPVLVEKTFSNCSHGYIELSVNKKKGDQYASIQFWSGTQIAFELKVDPSTGVRDYWHALTNGEYYDMNVKSNAWVRFKIQYNYSLSEMRFVYKIWVLSDIGEFISIKNNIGGSDFYGNSISGSDLTKILIVSDSNGSEHAIYIDDVVVPGPQQLGNKNKLVYINEEYDTIDITQQYYAIQYVHANSKANRPYFGEFFEFQNATFYYDYREKQLFCGEYQLGSQYWSEYFNGYTANQLNFLGWDAITGIVEIMTDPDAQLIDALTLHSDSSIQKTISPNGRTSGIILFELGLSNRTGQSVITLGENSQSIVSIRSQNGFWQIENGSMWIDTGILVWTVNTELLQPDSGMHIFEIVWDTDQDFVQVSIDDMYCGKYVIQSNITTLNMISLQNNASEGLVFFDNMYEFPLPKTLMDYRDPNFIGTQSSARFWWTFNGTGRTSVYGTDLKLFGEQFNYGSYWTGDFVNDTGYWIGGYHLNGSFIDTFESVEDQQYWNSLWNMAGAEPEYIGQGDFHRVYDYGYGDFSGVPNANVLFMNYTLTPVDYPDGAVITQLLTDSLTINAYTNTMDYFTEEHFAGDLWYYDFYDELDSWFDEEVLNLNTSIILPNGNRIYDIKLIDSGIGGYNYLQYTVQGPVAWGPDMEHLTDVSFGVVFSNETTDPSYWVDLLGYHLPINTIIRSRIERTDYVESFLSMIYESVSNRPDELSFGFQHGAWMRMNTYSVMDVNVQMEDWGINYSLNNNIFGHNYIIQEVEDANKTGIYLALISEIPVNISITEYGDAYYTSDYNLLSFIYAVSNHQVHTRNGTFDIGTIMPDSPFLSPFILYKCENILYNRTFESPNLLQYNEYTDFKWIEQNYMLKSINFNLKIIDLFWISGSESRAQKIDELAKEKIDKVAQTFFRSLNEFINQFKMRVGNIKLSEWLRCIKKKTSEMTKKQIFLRNCLYYDSLKNSIILHFFKNITLIDDKNGNYYIEKDKRDGSWALNENNQMEYVGKGKGTHCLRKWTLESSKKRDYQIKSRKSILYEGSEIIELNLEQLMNKIEDLKNNLKLKINSLNPAINNTTSFFHYYERVNGWNSSKTIEKVAIMRKNTFPQLYNDFYRNNEKRCVCCGQMHIEIMNSKNKLISLIQIDHIQSQAWLNRHGFPEVIANDLRNAQLLCTFCDHVIRPILVSIYKIILKNDQFKKDYPKEELIFKTATTEQPLVPKGIYTLDDFNAFITKYALNSEENKHIIIKNIVSQIKSSFRVDPNSNKGIFYGILANDCEQKPFLINDLEGQKKIAEKLLYRIGQFTLVCEEYNKLLYSYQGYNSFIRQIFRENFLFFTSQAEQIHKYLAYVEFFFSQAEKHIGGYKDEILNLQIYDSYINVFNDAKSLIPSQFTGIFNEFYRKIGDLDDKTRIPILMTLDQKCKEYIETKDKQQWLAINIGHFKKLLIESGLTNEDFEKYPITNFLDGISSLYIEWNVKIQTLIDQLDIRWYQLAINDTNEWIYPPPASKKYGLDRYFNQNLHTNNHKSDLKLSPISYINYKPRNWFDLRHPNHFWHLIFEMGEENNPILNSNGHPLGSNSIQNTNLYYHIKGNVIMQGFFTFSELLMNQIQSYLLMVLPIITTSTSLFISNLLSAQSCNILNLQSSYLQVISFSGDYGMIFIPQYDTKSNTFMIHVVEYGEGSSRIPIRGGNMRYLGSFIRPLGNPNNPSNLRIYDPDWDEKMVLNLGIALSLCVQIAIIYLTYQFQLNRLNHKYEMGLITKVQYNKAFKILILDCVLTIGLSFAAIIIHPLIGVLGGFLYSMIRYLIWGSPKVTDLNRPALFGSSLNSDQFNKIRLYGSLEVGDTINITMWYKNIDDFIENDLINPAQHYAYLGVQFGTQDFVYNSSRWAFGIYPNLNFIEGNPNNELLGEEACIWLTNTINEVSNNFNINIIMQSKYESLVIVENPYNVVYYNGPVNKTWSIQFSVSVMESTISEFWNHTTTMYGLDTDYDNDGLTLQQEYSIGTDPTIADTDNEGILDGEELSLEVRIEDKWVWNNTLGDYQFIENFEYISVIYFSNPLSSDSDYDGLSDLFEVQYHTNPMVSDTDFEGLTDWVEYRYGTSPTTPDTDGDGLDDYYEMYYGLSALSSDTDRDGYSDLMEIVNYQDPWNANILEYTIYDTLGYYKGEITFDEFTIGSDPWNRNTTVESGQAFIGNYSDYEFTRNSVYVLNNSVRIMETDMDMNNNWTFDCFLAFKEQVGNGNASMEFFFDSGVKILIVLDETYPYQCVEWLSDNQSLQYYVCNHNYLYPYEAKTLIETYILEHSTNASLRYIVFKSANGVLYIDSPSFSYNGHENTYQAGDYLDEIQSPYVYKWDYNSEIGQVDVSWLDLGGSLTYYYSTTPFTSDNISKYENITFYDAFNGYNPSKYTNNSLIGVSYMSSDKYLCLHSENEATFLNPGKFSINPNSITQSSTGIIELDFRIHDFGFSYPNGTSYPVIEVQPFGKIGFYNKISKDEYGVDAYKDGPFFRFYPSDDPEIYFDTDIRPNFNHTYGKDDWDKLTIRFGQGWNGSMIWEAFLTNNESINGTITYSIGTGNIGNKLFENLNFYLWEDNGTAMIFDIKRIKIMAPMQPTFLPSTIYNTGLSTRSPNTLQITVSLNQTVYFLPALYYNNSWIYGTPFNYTFKKQTNNQNYEDFETQTDGTIPIGWDTTIAAGIPKLCYSEKFNGFTTNTTSANVSLTYDYGHFLKLINTQTEWISLSKPINLTLNTGDKIRVIINNTVFLNGTIILGTQSFNISSQASIFEFTIDIDIIISSIEIQVQTVKNVQFILTLLEIYRVPNCVSINQHKSNTGMMWYTSNPVYGSNGYTTELLISDLADSSSSYASITNFKQVYPQQSEYMEFKVRSNNTQKLTEITLLGYNVPGGLFSAIKIRMQNNQIVFGSGSYQYTIPKTIDNNIWYHIRIEFQAIRKQASVFIEMEYIDTYPLDDFSVITGFNIQTGLEDKDYWVALDDIGFSWNGYKSYSNLGESSPTNYQEFILGDIMASENQSFIYGYQYFNPFFIDDFQTYSSIPYWFEGLYSHPTPWEVSHRVGFDDDYNCWRSYPISRITQPSTKPDCIITPSSWEPTDHFLALKYYTDNHVFATVEFPETIYNGQLEVRFNLQASSLTDYQWSYIDLVRYDESQIKIKVDFKKMENEDFFKMFINDHHVYNIIGYTSYTYYDYRSPTDRRQDLLQYTYAYPEINLKIIFSDLKCTVYVNNTLVGSDISFYNPQSYNDMHRMYIKAFYGAGINVKSITLPSYTNEITPIEFWKIQNPNLFNGWINYSGLTYIETFNGRFNVAKLNDSSIFDISRMTTTAFQAATSGKIDMKIGSSDPSKPTFISIGQTEIVNDYHIKSKNGNSIIFDDFDSGFNTSLWQTNTDSEIVPNYLGRSGVLNISDFSNPYGPYLKLSTNISLDFGIIEFSFKPNLNYDYQIILDPIMALTNVYHSGYRTWAINYSSANPEHYGVDTNIRIEEEFTEFRFEIGIDPIDQKHKVRVFINDVEVGEGLMPITNPLINNIIIKNQYGTDGFYLDTFGIYEFDGQPILPTTSGNYMNTHSVQMKISESSYWALVPFESVYIMNGSIEKYNFTTQVVSIESVFGIRNNEPYLFNCSSYDPRDSDGNGFYEALSWVDITPDEGTNFTVSGFGWQNITQPGYEPQSEILDQITLEFHCLDSSYTVSINGTDLFNGKFIATASFINQLDIFTEKESEHYCVYIDGVGYTIYEIDKDFDGIYETEELYKGTDKFITDPTKFDTDDDGMSDGFELGVTHYYEYYAFSNWTLGSLFKPNNISDAYQDFDNDGVMNLYEFGNGTDPTDADTDGDLMWDAWEIQYGFIPYLAYDRFIDSDQDGLTNANEFILNPILNPLNIDSDGDDMPDGWEVSNDLDPIIEDHALDNDDDGLINLDEYICGTLANMNDTDEDNLDDGDEAHVWNTNPLDHDTDDDTLIDGMEIKGIYVAYPLYRLVYSHPKTNDTDYDGLLDQEEVNGYFGYKSDPSNNDTDNDGVQDGVEIMVYFTNPTNNDTDNDGLSDEEEIILGIDGYITNPTLMDSDNDMINDYEESITGIDGFITNPSCSDSDLDGITDYWEWQNSTNPNDGDTDHDFLNDSEEITVGEDENITNATNPDSDYDELNDYWEWQNGTYPWDNDTDNDEIQDGEECVIGEDGYITNPKLMDSDNDLMNDYNEIHGYSSGIFSNITTSPIDPDLDNDGVWDGNETTFGTNPKDNDTDDDGLDDWIEIHLYLNPLNCDTDNDNVSDGLELHVFYTNPLGNDSDGDNLVDGQELFGVNGYTSYPLQQYSDSDGFRDDEEVYIGVDGYITDPKNNDTDGDGLSDSLEYNWGVNRNNYTSIPIDQDSDDDLLNDGIEYNWGSSKNSYYSNPLHNDTDDDELIDFIEYNWGYSGYYSNPMDIDTDDDMASDESEYLFNTNPFNGGSFPISSHKSSSLSNIIAIGPGGTVEQVGGGTLWNALNDENDETYLKRYKYWFGLQDLGVAFGNYINEINNINGHPFETQFVGSISVTFRWYAYTAGGAVQSLDLNLDIMTGDDVWHNIYYNYGPFNKQYYGPVTATYAPQSYSSNNYVKMIRIWYDNAYAGAFDSEAIFLTKAAISYRFRDIWNGIKIS